MNKFIATASVVLATAFSALAGCNTGMGIPSTSNPTATVYADLNGNGIPDLWDNCPGVKNAGAADLVDLGLACAIPADCLLAPPAGNGTKLANGQPVPVATNQGKSSPVGVFCVAQKCVMQRDTDLDGAGDECDDDDDGDRIADALDNCPERSNATQANNDKDGEGDECDDDDDNDTKPDTIDNCPLVANADQKDTDGNGKGDVCDGDDDGDGKLDAADNCPLIKNADQKDTDGDKAGDVCDLDDDGDDDPDATDCVPLDATIFVGQIEACNDKDDSCDGNTDEGFIDTDGDKVANCVDTDDDNDTKPDTIDNCPLVANADQKDTDGNGKGDVCDGDDDGDGKLDAADNCPLVANADQKDTDSDGQGDLCDGDCDGDGIFDSSPCTGDFDGDGSVPPQDCLEGNASVKPGAPELCNGVDDDCDGSVDESATCPSGKVCGGLMGCIQDPNAPPGPECTINADCDDGNACTNDSCVAQKCAHPVKSCDDGLKCTNDTCDPATGCKVAGVICPQGQTCTPSTGQCTAACTPACTNKQCGDDGCGAACGSCTGGNICDATGVCQAAPTAGTLTVSWAFAAASVPGTIDELRLMVVCKDSASTTVIPWGNKTSAMKPFPASLSFTTVNDTLASCEINVVGLTGGKAAWWAASCDGVGTCLGVGEVSISYFDGSKTWAATKLATKDNLQGGVNWYSKPGEDTDGDTKPDMCPVPAGTCTADPFPADGTK